MSQEGRLPLRGSERRRVERAEPIGSPNADERLEVTIRVRRRRQAEFEGRLRELGSQPPSQRQHLSREEYAEQFGADPADLAAVEQFARAHGLAVVEVSGPRRSVVVSGTVAQLSAAFGVSLQLFNHPQGGTFRGHEGAIYVPADLADIVEGVFGLDNRPQAYPHFRRADAAAASAGFSPAQIAQLYDFPTGVSGQGQCVAIIELGGGYTTSDLQTYFRELGIPLPKVSTVSVDHAPNRPDGANGADGEVMLDIEVVGAVAPGASLVVYFAPNTDQGFIDAITTAVHDTTNRPAIVSISWGGPEVTWSQAAVNSMDQAFQAAAVMGVSVFCAAGDNGANDFPPGPDQQPGNHVDFPASSPNVTGCGGTRISVSGGSITQEVVWNDPGGGATGGGLSSLFPKPSWQTAAVQGSTRGVPDVAGDASPQSGYRVRVDGVEEPIGGTSAVAPLWAGLTALMNQQLGKALGFLNPSLYGLGASSGGFVDITQGDNNGYSAGPGWDPCTGLGRPDGAKLASALSGASRSAAV